MKRISDSYVIGPCHDAPYIEPYGDAFNQNPYPTYKLLRLLAPIMYWERGASWLFTRYEDVVGIQHDHRFSSRFKDWHGFEHSLTEELIWNSYEKKDLHALNDEDNQRLHSAVVSYFEYNEGFVRRLVEHIANQKLFRIGYIGAFDGMSDLAQGIAIRSIAQLFAIPERYLCLLGQFAQAYVELSDPGTSYNHEGLRHRIEQLMVGRVLIRNAIDIRRQVSQGELLIDHFIRLCDKDMRLSDTELVSLISILAVEGLCMGRLLIANTIFNLLHYNALETLKENPSLWPIAVREVLRFDFPSKLGAPRYALEDCEWGGVRIARGDRLYLITAAANRDPAVFERPDDFDITRDPEKVLNWGFSAHAFAGMDLALIEAEVAARRLFEVLPSLRLVAPPTYDPRHKTLREITSLKLTFSTD